MKDIGSEFCIYVKARTVKRKMEASKYRVAQSMPILFGNMVHIATI